ETETAEDAAVLAQQRRTQAHEAAVLVLEAGRARVELEARFRAAQRKPGCGILQRHRSRQHLHLVQRNAGRDARAALTTAFERAADADARVPDHHVAFDA